MTIKKVLAVKNGSYTKGDGSTGNRWVYIGHVHAARDGGEYITLDAHINLAAFPRKEGDSRVMVSMFEPRDNNDKPAPQRQRPAAASAVDDEGFDSEIPF